jgi:hypothetical protein
MLKERKLDEFKIRRKRRKKKKGRLEISVERY